MPEDDSKIGFLDVEERVLDIEVTLVRYGGVGMSYSPTLGLKREIYLRGYIEAIFEDPRFEGKPVIVRLEAPLDPEREEKIAEQGVDSACGSLFVRANVEPPIFDEGRLPLEVFMAVTQDVFDAVSNHVTETLDRIHRTRATLKLVGKSLPETGTGSSVSGPIRLTDLDVSEDKSYAIDGFEIESVRTLYPRKRILPIEPRRDERGGGSLSILLTDAAYQLDVPTGRIHSVRCSGSIVGATGKSYEGASVDVKFEEFHTQIVGFPFDLDLADELPERALFGLFNYWPKDLDKEPQSEASFSFYLKYLPDDAHGLIVPILNQVAGAQVVLAVYFTNDETELLKATDEINGIVRNYSFDVSGVRRRPTNTSP